MNNINDDFKKLENKLIAEHNKSHKYFFDLRDEIKSMYNTNIRWYKVYNRFNAGCYKKLDKYLSDYFRAWISSQYDNEHPNSSIMLFINNLNNRELIERNLEEGFECVKGYCITALDFKGSEKFKTQDIFLDYYVWRVANFYKSLYTLNIKKTITKEIYKKGNRGIIDTILQHKKMQTNIV